MKNTFLICFVLLAGLSCKRSDFDDLSGDKSFNGKLLMVRSLNSVKDTIVLQNKIVYLRYVNKPEDEFLYSVRSDNAGRFEFNNLRNELKYIVHARETADNIPYYGELDISTGNTLYLYPDTKKINGLILLVIDTTNFVYSLMNNQKVFRFSSRIFFDSLSTDYALDSLLTAGDGKVTYLNQLFGTYYFYSRAIINSDTFSGKKTIIVPGNSIKTDTLFTRKN